MNTAKRIAGGIIATLALVGAITLPATAANAAGSDAPTPYTVTAEGIQLPEGDTFTNNGHVNIKTNLGNAGLHFEKQNWPDNHPKKFYIGKSFIPWSAFGFDASTICVTWVQINAFNEHFGEGGQAPVGAGCVPTPPPFDGVTTYTPSYGATCDAAWYSHPEIKTGFGIANIYGIRWGATQAEAQAKPFDAYTPGTVVSMPFADQYVSNGFYFEVKVGYDGANMIQQIGQTRGVSEPCAMPIPEQPAPLTGSEVRDIAPICVVPADGTAEVVVEERTWQQPYVWNADTFAWELDAVAFSKWATLSSNTIELDDCAVIVPPAIDPPIETPVEVPTAATPLAAPIPPAAVQTSALPTTGNGAPNLLGYASMLLVALGLGIAAPRLVRGSAHKADH